MDDYNAEKKFLSEVVTTSLHKPEKFIPDKAKACWLRGRKITWYFAVEKDLAHFSILIWLTRRNTQNKSDNFTWPVLAFLKFFLKLWSTESFYKLKMSTLKFVQNEMKPALPNLRVYFSV